MDVDIIRQICVDRYEMCDRETERRFDLKDVSVYIHSTSSGGNNQSMIPFTSASNMIGDSENALSIH